MFKRSTFTTLVLATSWLPALLTSASVIDPLGSRSAAYARYTTAHSLGERYAFDVRDGWQSINVTDLQYKYTNSGNNLATPKGNILAGASVSHALDSVWNSLKGLGKAEDVTITWYTGHDLENPSCWANSGWAPTDASFACALTLEGWTTRPKCFKFLELCNGPKKCTFVRVVDTCAGCAPGSKHVDLTKAAFSQLADVDQGLLTVQMRLATEPSTW
ncbi:hypothetical protein GLOTRDRAFT_34542 [Gloeophyllum trabeum ATCC 11539]|uniref:RlpA-like protein double-psi beta-barrel domain-containing protein n=1 Tax=Gloeophyllum trabeum (strain ATCC 11539 / FP-39264 / Madison 617) TaxID=670483 RepID=S7QIX4_GLOTA|nr:uncharacterized protein GLOTRDRAFT_34542 [Gloeophyllum trabeum ATCC 11539]EPQ59302.1 hypothetical protein GLOTRDRAFT_34542 [Gloeophyllum trabeum ATCC 11539]